MWPFMKKEPKLKPPFEVGERFKYIGVEMLCCRHIHEPYDFKVVVAEYVTNLGEIKQIVFCPIDWASLEAERVR